MNRTTRLIALAALGAIGLTGCELIDDVLSGVLDLDQISLLGVMPSPQFSKKGSTDEGRVNMAVGAESATGSFLAPAVRMLEVKDDKGEEVPIEGGEEIPGFTAGSFTLLVDGTGSMEQSGPGCEGCPTDPSRFRVQAAQALSKRLEDCGPDWQQSLMEFNTISASPGYMYTTIHADFGSEAWEIDQAANMLTSDGGTPLWDSLDEVLDALLDDTAEQFDAPADKPGKGEHPRPDVDDPADWGIALVVISDGQDTGSAQSIDGVIARAVDAGVPIHAVGLGPASDAVVDFNAEPEAIADLRRLASETGGFYGYVSSADELPELADAIAKHTCGGYTELQARFAEPAASGQRVNGTIGLKNTPVAVPFTFTAP